MSSPQPRSENCPLLVSFSGIDGAGKSTQIDFLVAWLDEIGLRTTVVRFWDDIVAARRLREKLGHALFRGERGVGSPDRPVRRRDKNVRSWYTFPFRMTLCLVDTVRLVLVIKRVAHRSEIRVVVFDRYVYDQYANLNLGSRLVRAYVRFLIKLAPRPDIAFLLDADPELARARKPEYPVTFLRTNRASYLNLQPLARMALIPPGSAEKAAQAVRLHLLATVATSDADVLQSLTSTSG